MSPLQRVTTAVISRTPRGVIRGLALTCAIIGLALLAGVAYRNIVANVAIPVSTMLWGVTLLAFGALILQKGDVSLSVREAVAAAQGVRSIFRIGGSGAAPAADTIAATCPHCGKANAFCLCADEESATSTDPTS